MTHRLRILVLAFASLGAIAIAAAPANATTRVLGLHIDGDKLGPKERTDLFAALQAKLRLYPDIELKNPPAGELTDEMIDLECIDLDAGCLARLGKKYQSDKVVHVEVSQNAGKYVMHVRFVEVDLGKVSRDKQVEAARVADLAPALEAEVEAVFGKPPAAPQAKPGTLVIDVDSPDAVIQLGGDYLGTGTATSEIAPGEYTVRISQSGFEDVIEKVVVRSGQTTTEAVHMVAVTGHVGPGPGPGPGKKGGDDKGGVDWVVWGTIIGVVVVGGAIAIIAATSGGGDDVVRGPAVLGIDGTSAWRDPATVGGRR